jgi:hypothetical protein
MRQLEVWENGRRLDEEDETTLIVETDVSKVGNSI